MNLRNALLVTIGCVCLAIGAVGVALPLLPTTPFVLVACACFSGVPKLRGVVMKIPFAREHLENYQTRKGLPRKVVISSLAFLWSVLVLWAIHIHRPMFMLLFAVVGAGVTAHILCMASPKRKRENSRDR